MLQCLGTPKMDDKFRTLSRAGRDGERAVMSFDYPPADRETEPGATGLRCVEGIKYPVELRFGYTLACIANRNEDSLGVGRGADGQRAALGHCLNGVDEQVG